MNSKAFTLALVIAGIAMFMVYSYNEGLEAEYIKKFGKPMPVVVAKVDINELELLDDTKVTVKNVPRNYRAPGALRSVEEVYNTIATMPILKGEQITKPRITYPGIKTGLSRQVSVGKRAISIKVSEESSVGRLLKPGDRVDVMTVIDYAGGRPDLKRAKTILQDVLVLATGLNVTNAIPLIGIKTPREVKKLNLSTYTRFNTITLELDPFQSQKLIFLMEVGGKIYVSLRNNDDKKIVRIKGTKLFDLLGEDAAEAKGFFVEKRKKQ